MTYESFKKTIDNYKEQLEFIENATDKTIMFNGSVTLEIGGVKYEIKKTSTLMDELNNFLEETKKSLVYNINYYTAYFAKEQDKNKEIKKLMEDM
jgi:hypothetical protein